jgi:hypothetical protein
MIVPSAGQPGRLPANQIAHPVDVLLLFAKITMVYTPSVDTIAKFHNRYIHI